MKKAIRYMTPLQKWRNRWKLRQIIAVIENQIGVPDRAVDLIKTLEATEIMTRGTKKLDPITLTTTRSELLSFIDYMNRLHSSKLGNLQLARIALATLILRDEQSLKDSPEHVIKETSEKYYLDTES